MSEEREPNPYASSNVYDACDDERFDKDRAELEQKCEEFVNGLAEEVDRLMDRMHRAFSRDARGDKEELDELHLGYVEWRGENAQAFVKALMSNAIKKVTE